MLFGGHDKTTINNIGNSCYVNALSQLFVMVPGWPEAIHKINKSYGEFLIKLRDTKDNIIKPDNLTCTGHTGQQEDPTDILRDYIDAYPQKLGFTLTDKKNYKAKFAAANSSHANDRTTSSLLILPIKANSVSADLAYYTHPETIKQDPRDKEETQIESKQMIIENPNEYIMIALTIFSFGETTEKIRLTPNNYIVDPIIDIAGYKYTLIGAAIHTGFTIASGHYICIKKVGTNWYLFDDSTISQSAKSFDGLWERGSPYILLYQKVSPNIAQPNKMITIQKKQNNTPLSRQQIIELCESGAFIYLFQKVIPSNNDIIQYYDDIIKCAAAIQFMVLCRVKDDTYAKNYILKLASDTANADDCIEYAKKYYKNFENNMVSTYNFDRKIIYNFTENGVFIFNHSVLKYAPTIILKYQQDIMLCSNSIRIMVNCCIKNDPLAKKQILELASNTDNAELCVKYAQEYQKTFIDIMMEKLNNRK